MRRMRSSVPDDEDVVEALKSKPLCYRCVDDTYLRREVRFKGKRLQCSYCGKAGAAFLVGEVAELVDAAFQQHYTRTSDEPDAFEYAMLSDDEFSSWWERHGEPVVYAIMNAAGIPEKAASDIQEILEGEHFDYEAAKLGEESEFAAESHYEEKGSDDSVWQEEWLAFERALKTEARFISRSGANHLASVFDGITTWKTRDGRPLVIDAGPGTTLNALYRARVFQSDDKLKAALARPDQQIGSPPPFVATAGRMNAHGISVFYGADRPEVALAEVRPPVGSQVAVARFEIIKPIRLLDLTALSTVGSTGSIFDPDFAARLEREAFLRSLSKRMTRPVMPDDEAFEYLPTQAIADFLATDATVEVDGIIFPSVQAGAGLNVVLFHKAARVAEIEIPDGAEVRVDLEMSTEDGWEPDYSVIEEIPPKKHDEPSEEKRLSRFAGLPLWLEDLRSVDSDFRTATLEIALESVQVHKVEAVSFKTDPYDVRRHRWEKTSDF